MDRSKKIWSVVLLCALILLTVLIVAVTFFADDFISGTMQSQDTRMGAFVMFLLIAMLLASFLPIVMMFFGTIGVIISGVNIKIAQSKVIKGISIGFCALYSLLLLLGVALGVYYWIQFNGLMF